MFIARVSKGRTIQEFMVGVLIAPTVLNTFWFTSFGTTAIEMQKAGLTDLSNIATELVVFEVFSSLPMGSIISFVAIILIVSFFITSADSATFVLGMQSTYGSLTPPNNIKLVWGILQSTIALILLSVNGLSALQNTIIIAALPFSFVILLMIFSVLKALNQELVLIRKKQK